MNNNTMLIGTSLSFCLKDLVEGNVDYYDVQAIISGTSFEKFDFGAVDTIIDAYKEFFKENNISRNNARFYLQQLFNDNKIFQAGPDIKDLKQFICSPWLKAAYSPRTNKLGREFNSKMRKYMANATKSGGYLTDPELTALIEKIKEESRYLYRFLKQEFEEEGLTFWDE